MEYSSMKWGLFFLGEFAAAILVSAIIATLFLGGWQGPWLPPYLWFIVKTFIVYFVLLWMRSTLPRLRVDQLMGFAWKFLFPLSLINIFIIGIELILWPSLPWPLSLVNIGLAVGLVIGWSRLFKLGAGEYREWGYGLGIAKGMALTFIHLFRKPITVQYPEQKLVMPSRLRGYEFGWDQQRCTACQLCANACPHGVIDMTIAIDEKRKRRVEKLEMDLGRCMFCGLCIEACNRQALTMGMDYETATYRRGDLIMDMSKLSRGVSQPSAYARVKKAAEPGKEGEEE
jgi:NADH-quinone oxidoreductase chain I